jgi:hypothetical protein
VALGQESRARSLCSSWCTASNTLRIVHGGASARSMFPDPTRPRRAARTTTAPSSVPTSNNLLKREVVLRRPRHASPSFDGRTPQAVTAAAPCPAPGLPASARRILTARRVGRRTVKRRVAARFPGIEERCGCGICTLVVRRELTDGTVGPMCQRLNLLVF